jgi:hypothetical protein
VAFTSQGRARNVIRTVNAGRFTSLYPKYKGGRPPEFTLPQRREIKKIARSWPVEHELPFPAWRLPELAGFLVAAGWPATSGTRAVHAAPSEGVTFQRPETWKTSKDPGLRSEQSPDRAPVHDRRP